MPRGQGARRPDGGGGCWLGDLMCCRMGWGGRRVTATAGAAAAPSDIAWPNVGNVVFLCVLRWISPTWMGNEPARNGWADDIVCFAMCRFGYMYIYIYISKTDNIQSLELYASLTCTNVYCTINRESYAQNAAMSARCSAMVCFDRMSGCGNDCILGAFTNVSV